MTIMDSLKNILDLSTGQVSGLMQYQIETADKFIHYDTKKLTKILSRKVEEVKGMKLKLQQIFRIFVVKGNEHLAVTMQKDFFRSGIPNLDEILPAQGITAGDIIEFTGPPAVGKSLILMSIMINVLMEHEDVQFLLFDTKYDFSVLKFKGLLEARRISELGQLQMMKRVTVQRSTHARDIVKQLRCIHNNPQSNQRLKFIIIDSITTP
jgi:RecA/RadA recombinase